MYFKFAQVWPCSLFIVSQLCCRHSPQPLVVVTWLPATTTGHSHPTIGQCRQPSPSFNLHYISFNSCKKKKNLLHSFYTHPNSFKHFKFMIYFLLCILFSVTQTVSKAPHYSHFWWSHKNVNPIMRNYLYYKVENGERFSLFLNHG